MAANGPKLEKRQALLFRAVDVGAELFAMTAAVARAHQMRRANLPDAASAAELADLFCRGARRKIAARFRAVSSNDDVAKYAAARRLLDGSYTWLETDLVSGLFRKPDGAKAAAPRGAPAEELVSSR
jgi:hypothetical protein